MTQSVMDPDNLISEAGGRTRMTRRKRTKLVGGSSRLRGRNDFLGKKPPKSHEEEGPFWTGCSFSQPGERMCDAKEPVLF